MNERQQLAYQNPLFSILQITGNPLWREDRLLPTGLFFSTYLTVDAYEEPFSWHASAGFVRRISAQGNEKGAAIEVAHWDDSMKVIAMNAVADLLRGVGRADGGEHWDRAEINELSFQAWRRLSEDEVGPIRKRREAEASIVKVFPGQWEPLQRSLNGSARPAKK